MNYLVHATRSKEARQIMVLWATTKREAESAVRRRFPDLTVDSVEELGDRAPYMKELRELIVCHDAPAEMKEAA